MSIILVLFPPLLVPLQKFFGHVVTKTHSLLIPMSYKTKGVWSTNNLQFIFYEHFLIYLFKEYFINSLRILHNIFWWYSPIPQVFSDPSPHLLIHPILCSHQPIKPNLGCPNTLGVESALEGSWSTRGQTFKDQLFYSQQLSNAKSSTARGRTSCPHPAPSILRFCLAWVVLHICWILVTFFLKTEYVCDVNLSVWIVYMWCASAW